MTGYVISAQGDATALPAPLSWTFQYTSGVPCDSFQIRCLWEGTNTVDPRQWCTFQALDEDQVVFTGVVDECETALTPQGAWIDVSGPGRPAGCWTTRPWARTTRWPLWPTFSGTM